MKLAAAALALLVAGCGGDEPTDGNAAAADVAVPPAGAPTPLTPSTTLPPGDGIPGVSAPPPAGTPAPDGREEAVAVVRQYFGALADGRYAQAYRLWGDGGGKSGMTERAFADSFAGYASYAATIGTPGAIDAGAGQRYVTVPVMITGTLRTGGPFRLEGPVTLHRTGDIDGATAEQRSWRLHDSGLKPRPGDV